MSKPNPSVTVGSVTFANDAPLALIAGPCQLESRQHAFDMAGALKEMTARLGIGLVYKSSFDKANRTSLGATRGAGLDASLPIFADIRREFGLPVITDVHTAEQCALVAEVVDVLQVPPSCRGRPTCWSPPPRPARWSTSRRASSSRRGT